MRRVLVTCGAIGALAACDRDCVALYLQVDGTCREVHRMRPDAAVAKDATPDAPTHDVASDDDAARGRSGSLAGGAWLFPRSSFDLRALPRYTCDSRAAVVAAAHAPTASQICSYRDWVYIGVNGGVSRYHVASQRQELLTASTESGTLPDHSVRVACRDSGLVVFITERSTQTSAIMEFVTPEGAGTVRWMRRGPRAPTGTTGILEHAATEALLAWTYQEDGGPLQFYVAGPHGENPRVLATSHRQFEPAASGAHVVFEYRGVLHHWTSGLAEPERLTAGMNVWQWSPWLEGDHLVWLDGRHGQGSRDRRDNPEVYYMNLRTREERRITHDPPERPAGQGEPTVSGDWIVWSDFRDATVPNPELRFSDRMDLYAFNLRTGQEQRLVANERTSFPRILGDQVWFACTVPEVRYAQTFMTPLPRP